MTLALLRGGLVTADGGETLPPLPGRSLVAIVGAWVGLSLAFAGATILAFRTSSPATASYVGPIVTGEVYAAFVAAATILLRARFAAGIALR
ncbi:MAG TPA: hypothetical protein VK762_06510, partial [Polyangiaceae bacterium]|nr:hypothetical protein [Polyangiaceae bacterium]